MGWQLLICRPSDCTGRDRVAIWRQLRRCDALSLGNGTWVLSDDPTGRARADEVDRFIRRRRCHMLRFAVADADTRAVEVVAMVHAALDREWERVAAALDQVAATETLDGLMRAQELYVDMIERDPRERSRRSTKTAKRLTALVRKLEPASRDLPDWRRDDLPHPVLAAGGLTQCPEIQHVKLDPFPGFGWEREFAEFERRNYLPSDCRPELRLGLFTVACPAGEVDVQLEAITIRVTAFHRSVSELTDGSDLPVGAGRPGA